MGDIHNLGRSPADVTYDEIRHRRIRACYVVFINEDGTYGYASCAMSPEQVLMGSQMMRDQAVDEVYGDSDD